MKNNRLSLSLSHLVPAPHAATSVRSGEDTYDGNGIGGLQDLTKGLTVVLDDQDSGVDEQGSEQLWQRQTC